MQNDKAFSVYVVVLLGGVASVMTASVMAGFATPPTALGFIEHVSLGLAFRWAYKVIGGFEWADWSILPDRAEATVPAAEGLATVDA